MAQVTITLDLSDPEILTLMTEGVKSLSSENWTTIMAEGMRQAVMKDVKFGDRPSESWRDERPSVLQVLMASVTRDLAATSANTEYLVELKERLVQLSNMTLSRDILGVENLVIHCASHKLVTLYNLILEQCALRCEAVEKAHVAEFGNYFEGQSYATMCAQDIRSMKIEGR